jgi:hypothetical protein
MASDMLHHVVWYILADISEELTAFIIRVMIVSMALNSSEMFRLQSATSHNVAIFILLLFQQFKDKLIFPAQKYIKICKESKGIKFTVEYIIINHKHKTQIRYTQVSRRSEVNSNHFFLESKLFQQTIFLQIKSCKSG